MIRLPSQLRCLSTCKALENLADPTSCFKSSKLIGEQQAYNIKPKIGLEVHAQLSIGSKLFSRGNSNLQAAPNSQLDLLDVSIPGALPVLNGPAIRAALVTALGLNCTVQDVIHFDRKNYFYSDMPAGYQITQYNKPIAMNGYIDFIVTTYHNSIIAHSQQYDIVKYLYHHDRMLNEEFLPYIKRSQIKQLQLEQDSAKTLNDNSDFDLVDYNRSGSALMEIVFEPDLINAHEASSLVKNLIIVLKMLKTCDCQLQEGSLRVDANISIESINQQAVSSEDAGRVELKNLNSLKSLTKGISYEIHRQASLLSAGHKVLQESRSYDTRSGETTLLREKETALDYRYVPEPSIPPLHIDQSTVVAIKRDIEQLMLPAKLSETLRSSYNLDLILVAELLAEPGLSEYFLKIMDGQGAKFDSNVVADFLIYSICNLKRLGQLPIQVDLVNPQGDFLSRLSPEKMRSLFVMLFEEEISFSTAYEVTKCLFTSDCPSDPRQLVQQLRWFQTHDEEEIGKACDKIIRGMKNISKQYQKKGDQKYLRMMLEKMSTLGDHRVNIKLAIKCFDKRLRSGE